MRCGLLLGTRFRPFVSVTVPFRPFLHRYRKLVERFFNKLTHFRAIAIRFEKRPENRLALVELAAIKIWLRTHESVS